MHTLVWWALVLIVLWIVARVFLAVTSALLHVLLVVAVIVFAIWLYNRVAG
ncbi:MAG: hypothetical protein H0U88_08975 [Chthoniobacterales bacterium]|nr:hypothetical protein [Chthoniobacterales bacterium]